MSEENIEENIEESTEESSEEYWKFILKKHGFRLLPFILVIVAAFISGIYVFLWHNEIGVDGVSFWTYTFNDWSFGRIFGYLIWLILRELLLVGLPTLGVLGIIFGIMWFTLSSDKRDELKAMSKREEERSKKGKKASGGASACTALVTIAFLIIMAVNGMWETLFANMDLHYFVATYLWAMIWIAVIFGIPALIGGIIYLVYKLK